MWNLRTVLIALVLTSLLAFAPPAVTSLPVADGVTALITFDGAAVVVLPDGEDYRVSVEVFREVDGAWQRVALFATLRVFEDTGPLVAVDRVSKGFTSSADGPVEITFPASVIGDGTMDIFVTFSAIGGDPTPTSHYFAPRTALITAGLFAESDQVDSRSTRVVGL